MPNFASKNYHGKTERRELARLYRCVVVDEVHTIDELVRGVLVDNFINPVHNIGIPIVVMSGTTDARMESILSTRYGLHRFSYPWIIFTNFLRKNTFRLS